MTSATTISSSPVLHPVPRTAILIPAYNAEGIIGKALRSLSFNKEPHDIIVVDDGSREPLEKHLAPQPNLKILRAERNLGITRALNFGMRHVLESGYDYVARLDADDAAAPERLALQRAYLDEHPEVALVGSWGRVVSEEGSNLFFLNHPTDHEAIVRELYYNSTFLHPSLMIRTDILGRIGLYSEHYPSAEDYELVRRIAHYAKVANLPQYLIDYTSSTGGISQRRRREQLRSRLKVQWRYRNFGNPHFYAGIAKTLVLWFMPHDTITSIKMRLKGYRQQ